MTEYIDREAFLNDAEARYCLPCKGARKDYNGLMCRACWVDDMMGEFEDAPAADVAPVVRCRECKHFREYITGGTVCIKDVELTGGRQVGMRATGKDDFCSCGERKDDDEF